MALKIWLLLILGVGNLAPALARFSRPAAVGAPASEVTGENRVAVKLRAQSDWSRYIPPGSRIIAPQRDVILADVTGDGEKEVVIFYTREGQREEKKPSVLVLAGHELDYRPLWEMTFDIGWGFLPPSGVYDLNKSGFRQIVAYRPVGASCNAQLDVYQYHEGEFRRIVDWDPGTCQAHLELKDLDADDITEIIFTSKTYGTNPDIYRWNGKLYVLSNALFPQFYDFIISDLLQSVFSKKALPVPARMTPVGQAVEILFLQQRYSDVVQVCKKVLLIVDDPSLTTSSTILRGDETPEQVKLVEQSFLEEKNRAKAALHRFMAKAYQSAGKGDLAGEEYEKVKQLEAGEF